MDETTRHTEYLLFTQMRNGGRAAAREEVVRRYLPLARSLAARYRGSGEPTEDLEQVASVGLLNAIDRFDPERGSAFSSFAVPTILGELRRHFRDRTWAMRVPRGLQELSLRIEHARDELSPALGRQPTIAELAYRLHVSDERILQALALATVHHAVPLEARSADDDAELDACPGTVDDAFARAEDRMVLTPLLGTLDARDAEIVLLRFQWDLTQYEIARRVGVSQMHVSRVLYRSLVKLREAAASTS